MKNIATTFTGTGNTGWIKSSTHDFEISAKNISGTGTATIEFHSSDSASVTASEKTLMAKISLSGTEDELVTRKTRETREYVMILCAAISGATVEAKITP